MDSNNRISNLVNTQVPFFVRNDHQNFVEFLEAYYEWMEQKDSETSTKQYNVLRRSKEIRSFSDIDTVSVDEFTNELYKTFIKLIPENTIADKALILKHVKDFYRSRGTEKSIRFLMRILFNVQDTHFYYPKKDVLRSSDGKWFIEKSVKFSDVFIDGVPVTSFDDIGKFVGLSIKGNKSGATAAVERVDTYYEGSTQIRELKISNQTKDFFSGEQIHGFFVEDGITKTIVANTFSGIINTVTLTNSGSLYKVGDLVEVESNTGSGAIIRVDSVTTGNIRTLFLTTGGAGYKIDDTIFISDTTGTGATANVTRVKSDGTIHPNSYNIVVSVISTEANTNLSNSIYTTLNDANANTRLIDSLQFFEYSNTGPVLIGSIITTGNNYSSNPIFTTQANTRVTNLGILGELEIVSGGEGYLIGDTIEFINGPDSYGFGASAVVTNVNVQEANAITEVRFVEVPGQIIGGSGYSQNFLPAANVISTNTQAFGANIAVKNLLGFGANYRAISSTLGQILRLTIVSGGAGYETVPRLNLSSTGDGTAQAIATIVTGSFTYPGRWLNDDGFLSSYNFLQDRDYYQNFSYVIKVKESIEKYRKALKDMIHPAGMKVFGEYLSVDDDSPVANSMKFDGVEDDYSILVSGTYVAQGNANGTIIEVTTLRDTTNVSNVRIEFLSGDTANIANGIFTATQNNSNSFIIYQPQSDKSNSTNSSGSVLTSI